MGAQRNFGDWVVATRPWSFPAALVAMLMPLSYYFWAGSKAPWYVFILVIVMGMAAIKHAVEFFIRSENGITRNFFHGIFLISAAG